MFFQFYYLFIYFFNLQALTSPMQGFLNSIIYGWYNVQFRDTIRYDGSNDGGGVGGRGERRPLLDPIIQPRSRYNRTPTLISDPNTEDEIAAGDDEFW